MTKRRIRACRVASVALAAAVLLTACGGADDASDSAADATPAADDLESGADELTSPDESEPIDASTEGETDPITEDTEGESDPVTDDTQAGDDAEPSSAEDGSASGDLLGALLLAAETEASSDGSSDLYRQYLTQVFPCFAESYVEIFGDSVEPPYDAATVRANAESEQSLSLSLVDRSSLGPEANLAALDAEVECLGGVYDAKKWDIAFQVSDSYLDGTATAWLDYSACILDAVDATEDELIASHYYWYYDSGATDGPLEDPTAYFDLSSDLQARWSTTHGDSSSFDDPCTHPV